MNQGDPPGVPSDVDWGRTIAEAVAVALAFAPREAEDLVHHAVTLLFEGQAPYDPEGTKSLAQHLVEVGLRARSHRRRTERRRRRPDVLGKVIAFFDRRPPTPEEELLDARKRQREARLFERLVADLADDAPAHGVVLLEQQGIHGAQEQADASGMSIEDVRNARKRVARRAQAIAAQEEEDEVES